jgi:hypothetical protein
MLLAGLVGACNSPEDFKGWTLEDLPAERGFSLRSPAVDLQDGDESQICYFVQAPDLAGGQDYYISRVDIAQNPGSHHLNVFRVKTILGLDPAAGDPVMLGDLPATVINGYADFFNSPCWDSGNWADWPLIANSQHSEPDNPYYQWQLPENVGIRIQPGEMLMVQSHYVNYGDQKTPWGAKFGINFTRFANDAQPIEMGSLFATQQSIRVCQSNPNPTYSGTCRFPASSDIKIEAINGHFHSRGKQFRVYAWDGASITHPEDGAHLYTSDRWDDPPMATNVGTPAPEGGGVWWDCEYKWHAPVVESCDEVNAKDLTGQNDCCYTFGGNVDVGEHCNLFLYYYPAVGDVFCN